MKNNILIFSVLFLGAISFLHAQDEAPIDNGDYVEFNDRNNVVHGIYLGLNVRVGEIKNKDAFIAGITVAYVANQQFEIGFEGNFLYSEQQILNTTLDRRQDLIGAYGGLHLEPILFGKSRVSLSFPLLIGAGGVGYIGNDHLQDDFDEELTEDDLDGFFVVEPGVSVLFNISRYVQLEAGVKYRLTSKVSLVPDTIDRVNGFSAGIGLKVGIFNMGRNRYKKNLDYDR